MPQSKESRSLRQILREANTGQSADQQEVNAAVSRGTIFFIPALVTLFAIQLPAALPLYWLTSSTVAFWQQTVILKEDAEEADKSIDSSVTKVETKNKTKKTSTAKKSSKRRKKK
jgi:membrane protein insertase Oxa1/YidC/SpoIIIJ